MSQFYIHKAIAQFFFFFFLYISSYQIERIPKSTMQRRGPFFTYKPYNKEFSLKGKANCSL